jgi:ATP synthase F1 delta subunit
VTEVHYGKYRDPSLPGALIEDCLPLAAESTGISGLAERYAAALFELADERHALDATAGDLRELRTMLHGSADLTRMVRSPVLSRGEQAKAIEALAENAKLSELTRDFLAIVARNRRLFAVPAMIEAYLAKLAERRGMEIRAAEISAILKQQIANFGTEADVAENRPGAVGRRRHRPRLSA